MTTQNFILIAELPADKHRCKKTFQKKIKNVKNVKNDKNKKNVCKR